MKGLAGLALVAGCATGWGEFHQTGTYPYVFVRNGAADTVWVGVQAKEDVRLLLTVPPRDSACARIPLLGKVTFVVATWTARGTREAVVDDPRIWLLTTGDAPRTSPTQESCLHVLE